MRFTLSTVALLVLSSLGCCSDRMGSSVTVGEELSFPEVSNSSHTIKVRAFQSIKGARIWTSETNNYIICAKYDNAYTNSYFFGAVKTHEDMSLNLTLIPASFLQSTPNAPLSFVHGSSLINSALSPGHRHPFTDVCTSDDGDGGK
jgi:hypothetical protein